MKLIIHTDGGSRGNPGEAAVGVIIEQTANSKQLTAIKIGKRIGVKTNNEAEYMAVIEALKKVSGIRYQVSSIQFFMDSKLVCEQLSGKWKIKQVHLQELVGKVRQLEQVLRIPISYRYVPREENTEADRLVNEALDAP